MLGIFPAKVVYDNWGSLLIVANIFGYLLSAFAYIKVITDEDEEEKDEETDTESSVEQKERVPTISCH